MRKNILLIFLFIFQYGNSQQLNEKEKLTNLCKVWGYLKYYHPQVASGKMDWDKQLFEVLPKIEQANTKEEFSLVLENWIDSLGKVKKIASILPPKDFDYFDKNFDLSWIRKTKIFSKKLSQKLKFIENNRIQEEQYYVGFQTKDKNRASFEFKNEIKYPDFKWEDKNLRLLALFKYWNYVEYFFPYKYQMDKNWSLSLDEFLPRIINPSSEKDFDLAMREIAINLCDTHASTTPMKMNDYFGDKFIPVSIKIIDEKAIITTILNDSLSKINDIKIGDVITKVDKKDISQIIKENLKYVEGSNYPAKLKRIYWAIFNGKSDALEIEFIRNGNTSTKTINRYLYKNLKIKYDESKQENYKILENNIGYVDMANIEEAEIETVMDKLKNTKSIIFDIRNYPTDTNYKIAEYLNPKPIEFVKFTEQDLSYPGRFIWRKEIEKCGKNNPDYYKGKVIILVNEESISHSEYSAMCLQVAPKSTIIGNQTAGADGANYRFGIIKGLGSSFTTQGVFYPNKKETQRIGIVPNIEVKQTISGIQQGKDEILDRAVTFINTGK